MNAPSFLGQATLLVPVIKDARDAAVLSTPGG
jgi:hypothetical protein